MIDPQNGLQALFESMTQEVASDAAAVANTLQAQTGDAIARGQTAPPTQTLLDAALAQEPGGSANAPSAQGMPFGGPPGDSASAGGRSGMPLPTVAAAELAAAAGAANAAGSDATLEALTRLIGSAVGGAEAAPAATTASESAIARVFANIDASAASLFKDAATIRSLAALLSGGATAFAATAPGAPALTQLLALVRAAVTAPTEADASAARAAIANFLTQSPGEADAAAALARLAAGLAGPNGAAPGASPGEAARAKAAGTARNRALPQPNGAEGADAVLPIPERDSRGRAYDAAARARLARLGRDPRHGFAPEATAAYEAEQELGLTFERAYAAEFDYVDSDGTAWNVLTPREAFGLESLARTLGERAHLIISFKLLAPDQVAPAAAVVARLGSTPGAGRLVLVESEAG